MNNVTLIGRLVKDPELKTTSSGGKSATFVIAVDGGKDTNGNKQADYPSCRAFGKTADYIGQYIKKGFLVGIKGCIKTGKYTDQSNITHYTTDVWVNEFENLTPKASQPQQAAPQPQAPAYQQPQAQYSYPPQQPSAPQYQGYNNPGYNNAPSAFDIGADNDDVPF